MVAFVRTNILTPRAPSPSPVLSSPRGRFAAQCLQWSRDKAHLHTQVVPGNVLSSDGSDRFRFAGSLFGPSHSSVVAYLGFVALIASGLLLASSEQIQVDGVGRYLSAMGLGLSAAGVAALVVAYGLHRRSRSDVEVVIDVGRDRVTASELRALRERVPSDRMLWVFARRGFEIESTSLVRMGGIRCLSSVGSVFADASMECAGARAQGESLRRRPPAR